MPRQGFIDEFGIEINADNELAGSNCPVTPGRLRELYLGHRRDGVWHQPMSTLKIAEKICSPPRTVNSWLKKCGVVMRDVPKEGAKYLKTADARQRWREWVQSEQGNEFVRRKLRIGFSQMTADQKRDQQLKTNQTRTLKYTRVKPCEYCGEMFRTRLSVIKIGQGKYCSYSCAGKSRRGEAAISALWCPRCFQESLGPGGTDSDKPRYLCASCNRRTVNPLTEKPRPFDVEMRHEQLRTQGVELKSLPGKIKATCQ